jgi:hypothetical protein
MYIPPSTNQQRVFSGVHGYLTSASANVKNFILQESWATVAAYRPLQPPSPPSMALAEFLGCSGLVASYSVTWGGAVIYPTDYFEVQRRSGATWYPWYTGDPYCIPYSSGADNVHFRVRTVSIGGVSVWIEMYANNTCDSGGQPN